MGTHLLRLALLLATLQYAAVQATGLVMDDLLKNEGRILLKSKLNNKYLTGGVHHDSWSVTMSDGPPGNAEHWTIVPISNKQVHIRASNGHFIRHDKGDKINLMHPAKAWEKWTPVKNEDGSWSFTNQWNGWLSAPSRSDGKVVAAYNNNDSEKWILAGTWELGPVMKEVLANGGRHFVKPTFNLKYITGEVDPGSYSVTQKDGPPGDASHWTFVQTSDTEVALRASNGKFLGHRSPIALMDTIEWYENWTPVKNADGRWSLRSRWYGYWLSARYPDSNLVVEANSGNCEMFWLDNWKYPDTLMAELLANGGRYILQAFNDKYLTAQEDFFCHNCITFEVRAMNNYRNERPRETNHWTIVQTSDKEVALRSNDGRFLRHNYLIQIGNIMPGWKYYADLADSVDDWEMWTPVKNADGSWSFKSRRENRWLSAQGSDGKAIGEGVIDQGLVDTVPHNQKCEHWRLTNW